MIEGNVTPDGVPVVTVHVANRFREAIVDTGFNGHLELPDDLRIINE